MSVTPWVKPGYKYNGHKHVWGKTQRSIPGAIIYFNACKCKTIKAYDLEITSPERLAGRSEYDSRAKRNS